MYRQIELNPDRIMNKQAMREYMQETFLFEDEEYGAINLDALSDSLSEVTDQVDIILRPDANMPIRFCLCWGERGRIIRTCGFCSGGN